MVDPTGGIVTTVIGAITWVNSLPMEFKYIIFLASLAADSGIGMFIGTFFPFFQTGVFGGTFSFLISSIFNIQGFVVTSFQLFVLFTFLPIILFLLKNGRKNVNVH